MVETTEGNGADKGVPFMIAAATKRRLRDLGHTDAEIHEMTPTEALALLSPSKNGNANPNNITALRPFDEGEALNWLRNQPGGRVTLPAAELGRRWGWHRQRAGRRLEAWKKAGLVTRRGNTITAVTPGVTSAVTAPGTNSVTKPVTKPRSNPVTNRTRVTPLVPPVVPPVVTPPVTPISPDGGEPVTNPRTKPVTNPVTGRASVIPSVSSSVSPIVTPPVTASVTPPVASVVTSAVTPAPSER
jgi:hypothetical protein